MNHKNPGNETFLLVGLGNPGKTYVKNRHNIGFMFVDHIAMRLNIKVDRKKSSALIGEGMIWGTRLILAKPQTYMNKTGRSVEKLAAKNQVPLEHVLVVFDDLDLPLGVLRMRPQGGSSGHKGMKSIFQYLGSQEFPRIRFGIDRPPGRMDPAEYVLKDFSAVEWEIVLDSLERAADCFFLYLQGDLEQAMTKCNTLKDSE